MEIEKRKPKAKDTSVLLKTLKGGDCFHFATESFETAIKEDCFYMVVQGGKEGRVRLVNIADGLVLERDDCHRVVVVKTTLTVDV